MHRISSKRPTALRIAIVGTGPRGLSLLERLLLRLRDTPRPVHIWAIDAVQPGVGRIWRTSQPSWLAMNTVVSHVTMYSARGPSLHEWLRNHPSGQYADVGPNDYASRAVYGRYLFDFFLRLTNDVPEGVEVSAVRAEVMRIDESDGRYVLTLDGEETTFLADKVILTTGHPRNLPSESERKLIEHAQKHPGLHYIPADSPADMDLGVITRRDIVALRGMGLTFYDIVSSLTVGRGGSFTRDREGRMRYLPSNKEPTIIAGSRSGLPYLPRGKNQKEPGDAYRPIFLNAEVLRQLRQSALMQRGSSMLDFAAEVEPLIHLEVEHMYYTTLARARHGPLAAATFSELFTQLARTGSQREPLLAIFGLDGVPRVDLQTLARPFRGQYFAAPHAFQTCLMDLLRRDLSEAAKGNCAGPLKAALDVLRDVRPMVRAAVDYSGLLPFSQRDDFEGEFAPASSLLSTGPSAERVEQLVALMEEGIVQIVGPSTRFTTLDEPDGRFGVFSPQVEGSMRLATVLIEARMPNPNLARNISPLLHQMLTDGLISEHVSIDPTGGDRFETGGIAVTPAPYHVLDARGRANANIYCLGVPTEHTRWFTNVGSGTPDVTTAFVRDADAIAADALSSSAGSEQVQEEVA